MKETGQDIPEVNRGSADTGKAAPVLLNTLGTYDKESVLSLAFDIEGRSFFSGSQVEDIHVSVSFAFCLNRAGFLV